MANRTRTTGASAHGDPVNLPFDSIEEIGVRDGADLEVQSYEFAPEFPDLDHDRGVPGSSYRLRRRST